MLEIYKTINNKLAEVKDFEINTWVNLVMPTADEIKKVTDGLNVDVSLIKAALDVEEPSRIESEDDVTLIIIDIPTTQKDANGITFETIPLGVILLKDNIITVCTKTSSVISGFSDGVVKNVYTHMKTRFLLQLLYRMSTRYLFYLKQVDRMSSYIEKQLHRSTKNKEVIQLLELEKSLVYFSTSLKGNEITIEKLRRGKFVKFYEEDEDLLEDVLIELKQAIEMSNIYSNILSGTMDAFASVISNNLNIVMKVLTSITILMAVPTMIASFFGMNVSHIPVPNFWFPVFISVVITGAAAFYLSKKNML